MIIFSDYIKSDNPWITYAIVGDMFFKLHIIDNNSYGFSTSLYPSKTERIKERLDTAYGPR